MGNTRISVIAMHLSSVKIGEYFVILKQDCNIKTAVH